MLYTRNMATRIEADDQQLPVRQGPREPFAVTYPQFMEWLDGTTWELDTETDIVGDNPNSFRSNLFYQAHTLGLNLTTKTVRRRDETGTLRRYLLVRAW